VSGEANRAVWDARDDGRIGGRATLVVALSLARRTNADRLAYPSVRTLAAETEYGLATVHLALRAIVGAGLYAVVVTGRGRRATTYRLALSPRNANVVDNNGVAFHHGNAIAFGPNGVAFSSEARSVQSARAYKEETNLETGNSARDNPVVSPAEIPLRVAALRDAREAEPEPEAEHETPRSPGVTAADDVPARVAEIRRGLRRRHP
jgi:hypothetical protein